MLISVMEGCVEGDGEMGEGGSYLVILLLVVGVVKTNTFCDGGPR